MGNVSIVSVGDLERKERRSELTALLSRELRGSSLLRK